MLLTIAGIIIAIWLLGVILHIAGAFIHILLVVAVAIILYRFVMAHRTPPAN